MYNDCSKGFHLLHGYHGNTILFYYYFTFYHSQVFVNNQSAICLSRYIILETFKKICN